MESLQNIVNDISHEIDVRKKVHKLLFDEFGEKKSCFRRNCTNKVRDFCRYKTIYEDRDGFKTVHFCCIRCFENQEFN